MMKNLLANSMSTLAQGALPDEQPEALSIFDREDPRALLALLPEKTAEIFYKHYQVNPDLFLHDEQRLWHELSNSNMRPSATDNRLRLKFWTEFDRAKTQGQRMNLSSIIAGICTREVFYGRYIHSEYKVAWLLCPPVNYATMASEALTFGLEQLRDILERNHAPGGKIDVKLANLKLSIVKMLDDRVHGMAVQTTKTESKSVSLQVTTSERQAVQAMATMMSEDELNKRLKAAEVREREALHLGQVPVDVSPVREDDVHDD